MTGRLKIENDEAAANPRLSGFDESPFVFGVACIPPGRISCRAGIQRRLVMADLRIFSYLPGPRVWKATIAARFCGVDVEVRGAAANELKSWLWDFDARPLSESEFAEHA